MRINLNNISIIKKVLVFYGIQLFLLNALLAQDIDTLSTKTIALLKEEVKTVDKENLSLKKRYQETILKKALKEKAVEEVLESSLKLSFIERQNDHLDNALFYTEKAISFFGDAKNDSLKMAIWRQKGAVLFLQANYEEALLNYYKAKELALAANNEYANLVIEMNIGLVELQIGKLEEGRDIFLNILSFLDKIGEQNFSADNKDFYIKTLLAISKAYGELKAYKPAMQYLELGLEKSIEFNDIPREIVFLSGIGRIYKEEGEYKKAIEILTKAEKRLLEYGKYKRHFSFIYLLKGVTFFNMESYKKAIDNLLKTEKNIQETGIDNLDLQERYPLLAKSYMAIGDSDKALIYYTKYEALDKINDKKRLSLSNRISEKYDLEGLKKELEILESEQLKKESSYKWTIGILVVLLLVTLGIGFIYRKKQQAYKRQFETLLTKSAKKEEGLKTDLISDEKAKEILNRLAKFETQKGYLNQNCTLGEVAKKLKTNTSYLSMVINKYKGKSFSIYLSELRINNAVDRLTQDKKLRSYSIKSIAEETGFNRAESFSKAFKSNTGIYPSYFIKQLEKREVES